MPVRFKTAAIHDVFRTPEILFKSNFLNKTVHIKTYWHFCSYIFLAAKPSIIVNHGTRAEKPKETQSGKGHDH
jgi:hypothetical protein